MWFCALVKLCSPTPAFYTITLCLNLYYNVHGANSMSYFTARRITAAPILLLLLGLLPAHALDLNDYRLVDLTHPFNKDTIYWPTAPSQFELKPLAHGYTEVGYYY